jgi:hypothetical protein
VTDVERETEEAATPDEAYVRPPAKGGVRRWLPWALVVVFAATAIAMTWVAASLDRDLDEARGGETDVSRVAGQFAEAFLTLDYREMDQYDDSVTPLLTRGFRKEWDGSLPALEEVVKKVKRVSNATVDEVLVSETVNDEASAIVIVDVDQEGVGGPARLSDQDLHLSLVRVDGKWLIDDVTSGPGGGEAPLQPSPGSGSTPTTAP